MSKNHWSEYWSSGVITSLPTDFKANYDGELADYWKAILEKQTTKTSRVLDVCTGNGAVAILLAELAEDLDKDLEIHAVDASNINPSAVIKNFPQKERYINSISFQGNCLVEEMVKQYTEKFDLIVSQYGIEYCDTRKAAENIDALLNTGGVFVFVAHSPNTAMLEYMQIEQQVYQLLENLNVFIYIEKFSQGKLTSNGFKNKIHACLQQLSEHHQFKQHGLFKTWGKTLYQMLQMNNKSLKSQRHKVGEFLTKHLHAKARAKDMLDVSDKLINNPNWFKQFEEVGMSLVAEGELTYQGKHNVGHYYEFIKKA